MGNSIIREKYLMSQWSSGYNVDVGYTFGFYHEMSPDWLDYVLTFQRVSLPKGKLRYLELGCGYGFGLILLAGMHPDYEFFGIDFDPAHVAHGRDLAAQAGLTNIHFEEADFVDLARDWPSGWGKFDYVAAHGIYTWLHKSVRQSLVETIGNATKPGAVVYLSYNTLPGWTSSHPLQYLLRLWQTSESIPSVKAISSGVDRFKSLVQANSKMTDSLPALKSRIERIGDFDPSYLIHEYLHDNWHPIWFNQLAEEVASEKFVYVGTANLGDLYLQAILPKEQKEIITQYTDPIIREVMVDVLVNQHFRKDVFVRGKSQMLPGDQKNSLLDTSFVLLKNPTDDAIKFSLSISEVSGKTDVYRPLFDALEIGPKTLRDLMACSFSRPRTLGDTLQALTFMLHAGFVGLCKPVINQKPAKSLNRRILKCVADGMPYGYVLSPKIGGFLKSKDIDMMMAYEVLNDPTTKNADILAKKLAARLINLNRGLTREGKVLSDEKSMAPYAAILAEEFLTDTFESWKKLGVF